MTSEEIERQASNLIWQGEHGLTPRDLYGRDEEDSE